MIFVDTGAFIGHLVATDQHHDEASRAWQELAGSDEQIFTSNFVVDETLTLLARRTSYEFAAARGREILGSGVLRILRPEHDEEWEALEAFEKLADQSVSFTDCTSFALMRRQRIGRVFTFDRHFRMAGFETWPRSV